MCRRHGIPWERTSHVRGSSEPWGAWCVWTQLEPWEPVCRGLRACCAMGGRGSLYTPSQLCSRSQPYSRNATERAVLESLGRHGASRIPWDAMARGLRTSKRRQDRSYRLVPATRGRKVRRPPGI